MLDKRDILEFKRLYEAEFGEKLTMQEAHDRALDLFALFEILFSEPSGTSEDSPF